ncbi:hypothetical protein H6763_02050 [Candidatus Nomurabacteria bacterium]|nr:hypothetical protein [Candidatus Nomurabacteria bacterium]
MDEFDKKYGFSEDEKTVAFHRSRRMFCIYENKLHIAKAKVPYSHAVWFEREGWISREHDELMNSLVRGAVDDKGDIYFYVGYDFEISEEAENTFFLHLKELSEKLKLRPNAKIYGGMIKQEAGQVWPSRKEYGTLKENL